jgi:hypothetical protein
MAADVVVVNSADMAMVALATIEGRKKSHEQRWASEHSWN